MYHPIEYEISICILDTPLTNNDHKYLRKFTGFPVTKLNGTTKDDRVILGTIVNEKFYSGTNEIISLLASLDSKYLLFSNGIEVGDSFLEEISHKINNISLRDIR